MTVIIPARALIVEQEIKDLRESLRRAANKISTCENINDDEFAYLLSTLIPRYRATLKIAKEEMRLLLSEARPANKKDKP